MKTLSIIIGVAVLIALAVLSRSVFGLEKPQYTLVSKTGKLEIRTYEPVMLASTSLKGEYREETRNGFRIIANYIFGGNKEAEKVAMTAPVLVENPDDADFTMAFVMPKESVEKGLPTPQTDRLQLQSKTGVRLPYGPSVDGRQKIGSPKSGPKCKKRCKVKISLPMPTTGLPSIIPLRCHHPFATTKSG